VMGKVVSAEGSGRVKGRAKMSLALTSIEVRGVEYPIRTGHLFIEAQATKRQDAVKIGAGAGIGAAIGAIAGGGKGAAIGAAAGGGAGTGLVLATKGKEVQLGVEHKLNFALKEDAQIRLD